MSADYFRLDLSLRRRSVIWYTLGMAVYTLVVVALYPAFKNSTALDQLVKGDPAAAAVFGISGSLSTSGGWLNANIFANFFPLIILLMTVGYGAAAIAGQDEDGVLGFIVALPHSRRDVVMQKVAAMAVQAVILTLAVALCVVVGRSFEITTAISTTVATCFAVLLMGLDFGLVAMAIGVIRGRRGTAIGAASGLAAASYLISSMAPVISWLKPARYFSLFYWSVGDGQITQGVSGADFAVLLLFGAGMLAVVAVAFRNCDLH